MGLPRTPLQTLPRILCRTVAALALGVCALAPSAPAAADPAPLHGLLRGEPLWHAYRARFVEPSGRVVDTANGGITHSEGQGYAMLLAVAADDPATFARLWSFVRTEMALRADGLIAWRWELDLGITDPNNATDGDLLIAWALHEAGAAGWGAQYGVAAGELVAAMAAVMPDHAGRPTVAPGAHGFAPEWGPDGEGRVVNASYWVFPALDRLAAREPRLAVVADEGRRMIAAMARAGVPTDWSWLDGDGRAHPAPDPGGAAPAMAYNAVRLPLHLAWDGPAGRSALDAVARHWPPPGGPGTVPADGTAGEPMHGRGYRAVAALAACALHGTPIPLDLASSEPGREPGEGLDEHYYPASLHLLSIVAARGEHPQCL